MYLVLNLSKRILIVGQKQTYTAPLFSSVNSDIKKEYLHDILEYYFSIHERF